VESLFLDSSFVIALVFRADQYHAQAGATWAKATGARRSFLTTTFILDEAVTFLNKRGEHELAVEIGNLLLASPAIDMVDVGLGLVKQAWEYFVRHQDKTYSLTDCISFVVMKQQAISEALCFDVHFTQAGFQIAS
jgi:predicted nucleic acid-binding protein